MDNERYIVHIHFSTRPGVCMWIASLDGDVTTDVTCAFEFTDMTDGIEAVVRASQAEADRTQSPDLFVSASRDTLTSVPLPKALQRSV